jgi:hypothetical protein
MRPVGLIILVGASLVAAPAVAQTARVALDVALSADAAVDSTVNREPTATFDIFGAYRITTGLDVVARPYISRNSFTGKWQKQMYQLGLRYERPSDAARSGLSGLGVRVDAGQIPSPIGLGILENRADQNPLISQHSAYYLPLPFIDPELPRLYQIAASYPFGAQLTVSTRKWDARGAFVDSSPVRGRPFFDAGDRPRLGNWVAGFGVTPRIGLRLGAALAHGPYVSVNENFSEVFDRSTGDRDATMAQIEGEWSFGYTRIAGEYVYDTLETSRRDANVRGGWIEASQTLTPRLFVAGRADTQRFAYSLSTLVRQSQSYTRYEADLGFRLTPELTVRAGYLTRTGYIPVILDFWDDQFLASVVWQKKLY